mgnify:CR=1 FL=1
MVVYGKTDYDDNIKGFDFKHSIKQHNILSQARSRSPERPQTFYSTALKDEQGKGCHGNQWTT